MPQKMPEVRSSTITTAIRVLPSIDPAAASHNGNPLLSFKPGGGIGRPLSDVSVVGNQIWSRFCSSQSENAILVGFLPTGHSYAHLRQAYLGVHQTGSSAAGGDETEAIAGLLHDGPEDQGSLECLADILKRFGDRVGNIVEHCSDKLETPNPPWPERKRAYADSLRHADTSTLIVSIADKLHNARATVADLRAAENPPDIWGKFSATREETIWNYNTLLDDYKSGVLDARRVPLVELLCSAVDEMTTFT